MCFRSAVESSGTQQRFQLAAADIPGQDGAHLCEAVPTINRSSGTLERDSFGQSLLLRHLVPQPQSVALQGWRREEDLGALGAFRVRSQRPDNRPEGTRGSPDILATSSVFCVAPDGSRSALSVERAGDAALRLRLQGWIMLPLSMNGNTPFQLSFASNVAVYVLIVVVCAGALFLIFRHSRRGRRRGDTSQRWTTQDILVVAILAVLLEVYDNLIGDQFIRPIVEAIPFAHEFAVNDLPYMFLLITGIAIVRKPGAATAMVFLNFLLMQLLYGGSESSPLFWPYGLLQGIFIDLYLLTRRGRAFSRGGSRVVADGLAVGALRAFPATAAQAAIITPLLAGTTQTGTAILLYTTFNVIGNAVEGGIVAPLALRVARTLNSSVGLEEPEEDPGMSEPQASEGGVGR